MSKGLTYTSQSAAEQQAKDYRIQGLIADVKQVGPMEWKVFLKEGLREPSIDEIIKTQGVLTPEESEEELVNKGIQQKRINQQIEKATRQTEKQEVNTAIREAKRKLAVKTALEKTPEESQKAFIDRKKKNLEETITDRTKRGRTPGTLVPIYDPETNRIIDYRLDTGNGGAELEKKFRNDIKKVGDVPLEILKSSESVMQNATSGQNIKFSRNVPGKQLGNPGGISNMARPKIGTVGAVGIEKPAIAKVSKPNMDIIKIQTEGTVKAEPENNGKSIYSGTPYLKNNPN
jgi:hypothetical protein